MKSTKKRSTKKKKIYRCFPDFDIANFGNTSQGGLERVNGNSYKSSENIFLNALNINSTLKTEMLRFNNSVFMTRKLGKQIMNDIKAKETTA